MIVDSDRFMTSSKRVIDLFFSMKDRRNIITQPISLFLYFSCSSDLRLSFHLLTVRGLHDSDFFYLFFVILTAPERKGGGEGREKRGKKKGGRERRE